LPSSSEIAGIAAEYARELGVDVDSAPFQPVRWRGEADSWPTLHLEDLSDIPFLARIPAVDLYQHRARVRARDGDVFAAVGDPTPGYEEYCRDHLGLGTVELIHADPTDGPMAVAAACAEGEAFASLVAHAKGWGKLAIHPYMSITPVWSLADRIAAAASVPVEVCGPPPPITWVANDKQRICELTRRVVGDHVLVEERIESTPEALAAALGELATRHRKVALKRTRCASAMGNKVFDAAAVTQPSAALVAEISEFLEATEWDGVEPVIACAWEITDCSPSTQLWLPPVGEGSPRLDGVYEQLLEGEEKVFLGSVPSELPDPVNRALGDVSIAVATGLQAMGYVGRCSFDFLVVGELDGDFRVRLTECNGRWGGTSTPMHLVDRVVSGSRPTYLAQDIMHDDLVGLGFDELIRCVGDDLYDPKTGRGRYVFYNAGCLAPRGKFDVIAFGRNRDAARAAAGEDLLTALGV